MYDDLLNNLASHGYIVIGTMAATFHLCDEETEDQLRSIEWAKEDKNFAKLVDWGKKVGLLGFSMGGMATNLSAGHAKKVADFNIGAAVSLHPYAKEFKPSLVPVLYTSGALDIVTPPTFIEGMYL